MSMMTSAAILGSIWLKVSPPSQKQQSIHLPLYNLSAEGIHAVWSLRSRSGRGLIKLVLAGYPEIGVLPMSHFQHDHPYLCWAGLPRLLWGPVFNPDPHMASPQNTKNTLSQRCLFVRDQRYFPCLCHSILIWQQQPSNSGHGATALINKL